MAIFKVVEEYDGRLPVFNVVKEVVGCDNCCISKDEIIKSFDTYEEAVQCCDKLIKEGKARDDHTTPCGEEDPCI